MLKRLAKAWKKWKTSRTFWCAVGYFFLTLLIWVWPRIFPDWPLPTDTALVKDLVAGPAFIFLRAVTKGPVGGSQEKEKDEGDTAT